MGWTKLPSLYRPEYEGKLAKRRTTIAREVNERIIYRTPVRTGLARGSWIASYGKPEYRTRGTFGQNKSESEALATRTAINANNALFKVRGESPFEFIWITNSVPYIGDLEKGSSPQARAGEMFALSITEIRIKYAL